MSQDIDQFVNRLRERQNRLLHLDVCLSPSKRSTEKVSATTNITNSSRNIQAQAENVEPEVEPSRLSLSLKKNIFESKILEQTTEPEVEPSKLSLSHRKNIFERKILEEQSEKLKCLTRNEYLAKTKNKRVNSPPQKAPLTPQQQLNSTPQPPLSSRRVNTPPPQSSPICHQKVDSPSQPILSNRRTSSPPPQPPPVTPKKVNSSPLRARHVPRDANYEVEAMSLCSQVSDQGDDHMYPGLPPLEQADSIHSGSPRKHTDDDAEADESASDSEDIFHAQPVISSPGYPEACCTDLRRDTSIGLSTILSDDEPPKASQFTPMRTVSAFRLEQKKRAEQIREESLRSANMKRHMSELESLERKRKQDIRKQISELKSKELPKLNQIVKQAGAALSICLESSEFKDTESHADAEKHLLVNELRRVAIMAKIDSLNAQLQTALPLETDQVTGTIQFNKIEVPIYRDSAMSSKKNSAAKTVECHYYFVVVSHEDTVFSTDCVSLMDGYENGLLQFKVPSNLKLSDLPFDFVIKIQLYEIAFVRHTKKDNKRVHLPHLGKKKTHESYSSPSVPSRPRSSLKGTVELTSRNLRRPHHEMDGFIFDSNLTGRIHMTASTSANYETQYGNFLNIQDADEGIWRRYWCRIRGPRIYMWRYLEDEEAERGPLLVLDLRHCINPVIQPSPSIVCSRSNSFILLLAGTDGNRTLLRANWLCHKSYADVLETKIVSADISSEGEELLSKMNHLIASMRVWDSEALVPCSMEEMETYINNIIVNSKS